MKKRLALLWTPLVLALAMALPASTAAATGVTFTLVNQHCYGAQGQDVYLRVRVQSSASSTATKLTIKSKSQYLSANKWHTFYRWPTDQTSFSAGGSSHQLDYSHTHEGNNDNNWRIVSTLKAYNGSHVLASKTFKSQAC